jgi:hypothetical protein
MHIPSAIRQLFPDAVSTEDYLVQDDGNGAYIAEWNLTDPQPAEEELQAAWEKYQLNPPPVPLTPLEELQKQQTDLVFDLMMKGVL